MSSRIEPTAEIETMRVTPSFFMPQTFARKLMSVGWMRCPRPWRGRNAMRTPPRTPVT